MSGERSVLRFRARPHLKPDRQIEEIWEVLRDGEVVATIYGSREGIQILSERQPHNRVFRFEVEGPIPGTTVPGWSVTLLAPGETCPWCGGSHILDLPTPAPCPVCAVPQ